MEKKNHSGNFLSGLAVGILITLAVIFLLRGGRFSDNKNTLAEIQGETLSEDALRKNLAGDLVPVENDEYWLLQRGVNDWVNNRLLEKEAKAQGLSLEALYAKEVWNKVKVSYDEIVTYYNSNPEIYGKQPLEQLNSTLAYQIRYQKYIQAKDEYLQTLYKKYNVKIHLKAPDSLVEGLALPTLGGKQIGTVAPVPAPPPVPSPPAAQPGAPQPQMGPYPSKGSENAPVILMDFSDFHCGFCRKVAPTLQQIFDNYPGKIRWVFRHFPLSKTPGAGSFPTHEAAACAHEQGKFWEYHEAIYKHQGAPQEADLQTFASNLGLDTTKFKECLSSHRYQEAIKKDVEEGTQKGVQGTPTIFINDQVVNGAYPYEHFQRVIEGILDPSKAQPATPPPTPKAVPPSEVKFDDLAGRPTLGPKDASVTLVEFSDFYCPFCKKVTPALEQIQKNYSGKVRRVWRHYPLSFHQGSDRVHEASECAHEQGKFWKYHDKLFENQGKPFDDAKLIQLAKETDLDKKRFEKCLTSGKYKELIQKEIAKGSKVGVQGTPAVFVNGELVSGAYPYEHFEAIVKNKLAKS